MAAPGTVSTAARAVAPTAILAALMRRDRTGEGQHIDLALVVGFYHNHSHACHHGAGGERLASGSGDFAGYDE